MRQVTPDWSRLVTRVRALAARLEALPATLGDIAAAGDRLAAVEPDLSALDVNPFGAVPSLSQQAAAHAPDSRPDRRSPPPAARPPTDSREPATGRLAARTAPSSGGRPPAPASAVPAIPVLPVAVQPRVDGGRAAVEPRAAATGAPAPARPVPASTPAGAILAPAAAAPSQRSESAVREAHAAGAAADLATLADALLATAQGDAASGGRPRGTAAGAAAPMRAPVNGDPAQPRLTPRSAETVSHSSALIDVGHAFALLDRIARDAASSRPGASGGGSDAAPAVRPARGGTAPLTLDEPRADMTRDRRASGARSTVPALLDPFARADVTTDVAAVVDAVQHALAAQLVRHGVDPI